MEDWPSFPRRWTKLKTVLKPTLLVVSVILIFVPTYFNQISITRIYQGLEIPSAPIELNLNFTEPINVHLSLPYRIKNSGFHDLVDINLKITLKLNYTRKDSGTQVLSVILSEKERLPNVRYGKSISGVFYKDYSKFYWGYIGDFIAEADETKEIKVSMDLDLSFYMSWVEKDRILISDITLDTELKGSTVQIQSQSDLTFRSHSSRIHYSTFIAFFTILVLSSITIFIKKLKGLNKRKFAKVFHDTSGKRFLNTSLKIVICSGIIIISDFFLLGYYKESSIVSDDYILRYEIAIWLSIFILIIINIFILLPAIYQKKYHKFSIQESVRSLITTCLGFGYFLTFLISAVTVYQIDNSTIIFRNTALALNPSLVAYITYIGLKSIDVFNFSKYKIHYKKVQIIEERIKKKCEVLMEVNDFNRLIFEAINSINLKEGVASIRQIKRYFKSHKISTICYSGERLNQQYLDSLVNAFFLVKEPRINGKMIGFNYNLTPLSDNHLHQTEAD